MLLFRFETRERDYQNTLNWVNNFHQIVLFYISYSHRFLNILLFSSTCLQGNNSIDVKLNGNNIWCEPITNKEILN